MARIVFLIFLICSCLPAGSSKLKTVESHPIKIGDEVPIISVEKSEEFFREWDRQWSTENIISLDEEVSSLVKAIRESGQKVRLVTDGVQNAAKKKLQILTPVLSSLLPNKNDYYFFSKLMLPGHFALGMEFDGKLYDNGAFKSKKACKFMAGIPCMLSLEAKYSLISDAKNGLVKNTHCASLGCRFAGMWLYEIEIEKTSEGLKFSFPKAVAHTSFTELFEHSVGSPVVLEVSKKTAKLPKYLGLDASDNIIWTSNIDEIDNIKEFSIITKPCQNGRMSE